MHTHQGQQRATQDTHSPHLLSGLLLCPRGPTSRLPTGGLILLPAAEGVMPTNATRHQAQSGHTRVSSLLFSKSTDPGHFRTAIHLNKWHWAVYYLASRHAVTEGGAWQTSKEKQAFHHSFACSLVSYTFPSNASLSLASCFCFLFFPPLLVSLCHQNCCKKLDLSLYDYRGLHNDAEQGFQGKHR